MIFHLRPGDGRNGNDIEGMVISARVSSSAGTKANRGYAITGVATGTDTRAPSKRNYDLIEQRVLIVTTS